jgi:hypothetical protein
MLYTIDGALLLCINATTPYCEHPKTTVGLRTGFKGMREVRRWRALRWRASNTASRSLPQQANTTAQYATLVTCTYDVHCIRDLEK